MGSRPQYCPCFVQHTHLKKLNIIQNKCLRLRGGYLKSTPVNVMQVETVITPLNLLRKYLSDTLIIDLVAKDSPLLDKIHNIFITNEYWEKKKPPYSKKLHGFATVPRKNSPI